MSYLKDKLNHPGFQKYLRNTGWMFLGRIFSLVISFFVSVYTAKHLGVENFGTLNFIISFTGIAGTSFFAIDSLILKRLNDENEDVNAILGSSLIIKLMNAGFTILTATIASLIFANSSVTTTLVFVFSTFSIFQAFNTIDLYFKAKADFKEVAIANILTNSITAIVRIIVVSMGLNIVYLLATYILDSFIAAVGYVYLYNRNFGKITDWKINSTLIKSIIKSSWPFTIATLAATIYVTVDQVFLKFYLGSKAVGLYVVAVRFSEVWFFISSVICVSLLPAILNAQKTSHELFLSRSKKLYTFLFYLSSLICVFIYIVAPYIIKFLYSPEYIPSIYLLRIYIWSIIGTFVSTGIQQTLLAQNKFKTILIFNLISMGLSLVLNPIFILLYGIKGAAIANIFVYTLPILFLIATPRLRDYRKLLFSAIFYPFSR